MDALRHPRPVARRERGSRLVALIPLIAAACSYFPSHEEVYIPIPLDIGERRIENGDTSWVLPGPGYVLIASRQQVLADAHHELDAASRQFERYFGVEPDTVTIRYVDSLRPPRDPRSAELERLLETPTYEGEIVLPTRRDRFSREGYVPPTPAAPWAARRWIVAHARATADAARGGSSQSDTIRIPAWIASAMSDLVALGVTQNATARQLWRRRSELIPLEELLAMQRLDPERQPGDRLSSAEFERLMLRRLQSVSLALFIADREDPRFLGQVAERLFLGRPIAEALRGGESIPTDVAALDREWRNWLQGLAENR